MPRVPVNMNIFRLPEAHRHTDTEPDWIIQRNELSMQYWDLTGMA